MVVFLRYPAPTGVPAAYGQPPPSLYNSAQAPPPGQQLSNQMGAMSLNSYGASVIC